MIPCIHLLEIQSFITHCTILRQISLHHLILPDNSPQKILRLEIRHKVFLYILDEPSSNNLDVFLTPPFHHEFLVEVSIHMSYSLDKNIQVFPPQRQVPS